MDDIDKFIKALNDAITAKENYPWAKIEMSFDFTEMLIDLLKKQPRIVRCKDCKHNDGSRCDNLDLWVEDNPEWFCADGERR